jgi:hypothetical protein
MEPRPGKVCHRLFAYALRASRGGRCWGYVSERSRPTTTAVMLAYVGREFEFNAHASVPLAYPPARFTANPRSVLRGEVTRSKPYRLSAPA